MKEIDFLALKESDLDEIVLAFKDMGWNKPRTIYEAYLQDQAQNLRSVIVAKKSGKFAGYVTIKWRSDYSGFNLHNIPEISDLNVLASARNIGIGTRLIQACENMAKKRQYTEIGMGVGMTADYGNAQRLYVRLGYLPDGSGLHFKNKALSYGEAFTVDDDLLLYFTKGI